MSSFTLSCLTRGMIIASEVEAIKQYGLNKNPKWVLLMYFEGNDLFNTEQYLERQATGLSWKEFDFQTTPLTQQVIMPYMIAYWFKQAFPRNGLFVWVAII